MSKEENAYSSLDFIFKTPRKLSFTKLYRYYFDYILRLLYRVILIKGIPKTVNETFLKLILYTQGKICFMEGQLIGETGSDLLALNCSRSETPDVYYIPRNVLVTNPRLKKSYNLKRGEQCVVVYLSETDKYNSSGINGGLYNFIETTAVTLADNMISLNIAQKNTRLVNILSGDTQNTVDSIKAAIEKMYEGDPSIVVKSSLIDKLQGVPIIPNASSNQNLTQLIEVNQYLLAHALEQIGICVHDQMKKERVISGELNDNLSFAFLSVDDIIVSLNEGFAEVNAKYETELYAELNPIIKQQREAAAAASDKNQSPENGTTETEDAAPEDQTEDAAEDQTEDATPEDQTEDAAPEDQTEDAAEDQTEDAAPEDQTEDAAPEDQTEDAAPEDQNIDITIEGDNNVIIIEGGDGNVDTAEADELQNVGSDNENGDNDESV